MEHARQAGELHDATDVRFGGVYAHFAAAIARHAKGRDERRESGGIERADAVEVDGEIDLARLDHARQVTAGLFAACVVEITDEGNVGVAWLADVLNVDFYHCRIPKKVEQNSWLPYCLLPYYNLANRRLQPVSFS